MLHLQIQRSWAEARRLAVPRRLVVGRSLLLQWLLSDLAALLLPAPLRHGHVQQLLQYSRHA